MGFLNACTFHFNEMSSDRFNLYVGFLERNTIEETMLDRTVLVGETNSIRYKANQWGATFNSPITFTFLVVHKDGSNFSYEESRAINRWLMTDTYKEFKFDDGNRDNVIYNAICTSIKDLVVRGLDGKQLTFQCDSPFSYIKNNRKDFNASTGSATFQIRNSSDAGYCYPRWTINCPVNYIGIITITNIEDNDSVTYDMKNVNAYNGMKTIIIDSEHQQLMDGDGNLLPLYKIGIVIDPDATKAIQTKEIYFPRLVPDFNTIQITGTCEGFLLCDFARGVGVMV